MRDKIISFGFVVFISGFSLLGLFSKDQDISFLERRKLVTVDTLEEDFLNNFDDYVVDQFYNRNSFLKLNSFYERNILKNKEYNNVYLIDNIIYEKEYPLNIKSVNSFIKKMNTVKDKYFPNQNVYYSIIPSKSYYLDSKKYLTIDYQTLEKMCQNINGNYIDLMNNFNISDYYQTDIHLKQESWLKAIPTLAKKIGFNYYPITYQKNVYYPFYGASYSKAMEVNILDELVYLTNELQEDVIVKHLENSHNKLYNILKLGGIDSYDVFLNGASSFIEITNKNSNMNRELIIFRDSFASSLAPLLIPYYDKITLIDLRYINFQVLENYLNLNNQQDVLFLYSSMVINNSSTIKVN